MVDSDDDSDLEATHEVAFQSDVSVPDTVPSDVVTTPRYPKRVNRKPPERYNDYVVLRWIMNQRLRLTIMRLCNVCQLDGSGSHHYRLGVKCNVV